MVNVDFDKVIKHRRDLEKFKGYIPLTFHICLNMSKRVKFLKKEGLFMDVQKENEKKRESFKYISDSWELELDDVVKWVKQNPEYDDILVDE